MYNIGLLRSVNKMCVFGGGESQEEWGTSGWWIEDK